jgi:hypothetical protein
MNFKEMMPRRGKQYAIEIEMMSRSKAEYQTDDYFELNLHAAPYREWNSWP